MRCTALATADIDATEGYTTVMVRNMPVHVSQQRLIMELNAFGFSGMYDFCYLPCTLSTGKGNGYAFINFTSTSAALAFMSQWHMSYKFNMTPKEPALNISLAQLQGKEANVKNWMRSRMRRIRNPKMRPYMGEGFADLAKALWGDEASASEIDGAAAENDGGLQQQAEAYEEALIPYAALPASWITADVGGCATSPHMQHGDLASHLRPPPPTAPPPPAPPIQQTQNAFQQVHDASAQCMGVPATLPPTLPPQLLAIAANAALAAMPMGGSHPMPNTMPNTSAPVMMPQAASMPMPLPQAVPQPVLLQMQAGQGMLPPQASPAMLPPQASPAMLPPQASAMLPPQQPPAMLPQQPAPGMLPLPSLAMLPPQASSMTMPQQPSPVMAPQQPSPAMMPQQLAPVMMPNQPSPGTGMMPQQPNPAMMPQQLSPSMMPQQPCSGMMPPQPPSAMMPQQTCSSLLQQQAVPGTLPHSWPEMMANPLMANLAMAAVAAQAPGPAPMTLPAGPVQPPAQDLQLAMANLADLPTASSACLPNLLGREQSFVGQQSFAAPDANPSARKLAWDPVGLNF